MHYIDFLGSLDLCKQRGVFWDLIPKNMQQVVSLLLLVLFGKSSWGDMVKILEPLEVRNSHSSCVGEDIRDNSNSFLSQKLIGHESHWSIGTLNHDLASEVVDVVDVNSAI
jgi:hypothetical protein